MRSDEVCEKVAAFFKSFIPGAPQGICVAVSGGSDSVALFRVLNSLKDRLDFDRLSIAHVNHRLRGDESDADALFVKNIARDAGVDFFLKELEKPLSSSGLEEWGRRERYEFFRRIRETEGFSFIATGHTADDQAETVLMRLMRGCGLKGLRSLLPVRDDGIVRPLLSLSRESLRDWLAGRNIGFREDASNEDVRFRRNWIRHELLPRIAEQSPDAVKNLVKIAEHARRGWIVFQPVITDWLARNVVHKGVDKYAILKCGLNDAEIAEEALAEFFRLKNIPFESKHITELLSNCSKNKGKILLPTGWRYLCKQDVFEFSRDCGSVKAVQTNGEDLAFSYEIADSGNTLCENEKLMFEVTKFKSTDRPDFSFSKDNWIIYLDAEEICGPLVFRSIKPDDFFRPLGSDGLRNVKTFLKKQKLLMCGLAGKGVVSNKNGEIVWLPGVRISHAFRLTPQTMDILKISCKIIG